MTFPEDRRNAPLAWSGALGGSLAVWVIGALAAYDKTVSHIHDGPLLLLMAAGVLSAAVLATSRGYASEVRPRIRLGRRLGGAIGFGFLVALALALLFAIFVTAASPHSSTARTTSVLIPAFIACAALAGVHVLAPSRRASLREAVLSGAAILFATLYIQSTWVRYALGSETAALDLAIEHYQDGDYEISARYFEIACKRGDDLACVRASAQYDAGLGVHVDAKHADALLRLACDEPEACLELASSAGDARTKERAAKRACDLAGGKYCDRYRVAVLAGACEERDVFACRDLARINEGSGMARYFYQKACGFGDVEACAKAR